ncbi:MAG: hypothetical protein HYT76_00015 [Deltaproteobacteria bacterium]|nr:hypothetical protein [Deltaproteobacteria bacterium]
MPAISTKPLFSIVASAATTRLAGEPVERFVRRLARMVDEGGFELVQGPKANPWLTLIHAAPGEPHAQPGPFRIPYWVRFSAERVRPDKLDFQLRREADRLVQELRTLMHTRTMRKDTDLEALRTALYGNSIVRVLERNRTLRAKGPQTFDWRNVVAGGVGTAIRSLAEIPAARRVWDVERSVDATLELLEMGAVGSNPLIHAANLRHVLERLGDSTLSSRIERAARIAGKTPPAAAFQGRPSLPPWHGRPDSKPLTWDEPVRLLPIGETCWVIGSSKELMGYLALFARGVLG